MKVKDVINLLQGLGDEEYYILGISQDYGSDDIYISKNNNIKGYKPYKPSDFKFLDKFGNSHEIYPDQIINFPDVEDE